jgi:sialate O-acetylesterase
MTADPGNKGEAAGFADPARDREGWKKMRLPGLLESAGLDVDGVVWFRREVLIPAAWAGQDLSLSLGAIDDFDTTYFNGERVGATGTETPNSYMAPRRYRVPGRLVRAGANVVAVRVYDRMGGGGFSGGDLSLTPAGGPKQEPLALAGEWDYKPEFVVPGARIDFSTQPQPPGPRNHNNPTVLYNAMIAPLTPFHIRGAVWYQGESNAGRAHQYRTLFPAMINDWRRAWRDEGGFPFYFVQLANWRPARPEPSESDWAELREAQFLTMRRVPRTGMAVAIDIGDPADIHPRNKLDVGLRLARWARRQTYGQRIVPSGPLYVSHGVEGERVRVRFEHAAGLKTRDGSAPKGFAVAGADRKFVWAEARIEGDAVVVWSPRVPRPVAVRYAWADSPACNLYNGAGLPASPFRTDDWPGVTDGRR